MAVIMSKIIVVMITMKIIVVMVLALNYDNNSDLFILGYLTTPLTYPIISSNARNNE
jgi:hypothetical protein